MGGNRKLRRVNKANAREKRKTYKRKREYKRRNQPRKCRTANSGRSAGGKQDRKNKNFNQEIAGQARRGRRGRRSGKN